MSETALILIVLVAFFGGGLAAVILMALMIQSGRCSDAEDREIVRRMIEEGRA
jgi:hypothetical protein